MHMGANGRCIWEQTEDVYGSKRVEKKKVQAIKNSAILTPSSCELPSDIEALDTLPMHVAVKI